MRLRKNNFSLSTDCKSHRCGFVLKSHLGLRKNDELKLREFHKSVKKHTRSEDPSWRGKERLNDESKKSTLQETTKLGTEPE